MEENKKKIVIVFDGENEGYTHDDHHWEASEHLTVVSPLAAAGGGGGS